ncbi:MAG: polyhydroxyalkanoic acid system family protein [Bdellovibrionota bacterium]
MPKFTIDHKTSHAAPEAYKKMKEVLGSGEMNKFDSKIQCEFNDSQHLCQVKGSQFKADLQVKALEQGSQVSITVDLPFLLTPFKGKVQEGLVKMLNKHLS